MIAVDTSIEVVRSSCHRSTWQVHVGDEYTDKAGPFNVAKRAAELITERPEASFEWKQLHADAWGLHIIEPDE